MNLGQHIDFMQAAANPFPLEASFHKVEGGGYKCKMCGAAVKDQGACADHLLMKHREMEAGGPGSGRHKESFNEGVRIGNKHADVLRGGEPDKALGARAKSMGLHPPSFVSGYRSVNKDSNLGPVVKPLPKRMEAREFSEKRRKKLAKSGDAMPSGGFPIVNKEDLGNAKQAIGLAKNPAAARRHINERAKELGAKPIGAQVEFSPEMRLRMPKKAGQDTTTQNPQYTGGQPELRAGGPGSGRHPEGGTRGKSMEELANMHKPHEGMCDLSNKVCRAYVDMKIEHPGFDPKGAREPYKPKMEAFTTRQRGLAHTAGFRRQMNTPGGKCSSHGFHRGSGYEGKAHSMGHRLPLSASEDKPEIRQRPARPSGRPRRASYNFRGEQQLI